MARRKAPVQIDATRRDLTAAQERQRSAGGDLEAYRREQAIIDLANAKLAIAGMHYTAMRASLFFPLHSILKLQMALAPTTLAMVITIFTVLIASIALDGKQLEDESALAQALSKKKPGDTLTLSVVRGNQTNDVKVTLGEAPAA